MLDLLSALDAELPTGSEVTLFNLRVSSEVVSKALLSHTLNAALFKHLSI